MNLYGRIVDGSVVERGAIATLRDYLPHYLAEVAAQNDRPRGALPAPRSYAVGATFGRDAGDQIPAVTLIAPGLAERPRRAGDGSHRASWSLGVAVLVSGATREATDDLAKLYTAAIRACLVQQSSLGDVAEAVEWIDERYDDLPVESDRTLAAGQAVFVVEVDRVLDGRAGPRGPLAPLPADPTLPPAPLTQVVDVDVDVDALT